MPTWCSHHIQQHSPPYQQQLISTIFTMLGRGGRGGFSNNYNDRGDSFGGRTGGFERTQEGGYEQGGRGGYNSGHRGGYNRDDRGGRTGGYEREGGRGFRDEGDRGYGGSGGYKEGGRDGSAHRSGDRDRTFDNEGGYKPRDGGYQPREGGYERLVGSVAQWDKSVEVLCDAFSVKVYYAAVAKGVHDASEGKGVTCLVCRWEV